MKKYLTILIFIALSTFSIAVPYNAEVEWAQKKLKSSGYNPGVIDGLWGRNTKAAVKSFQKSKGLTVTGELDSPTLASLKKLTLSTIRTTNEYKWSYSANSKTLKEQIKAPEGFKRTVVTKGSFADWLRNLPLKPLNSPVYLYNGQLKGNQKAQHAVIDIDTGNRDLQQCADAVMRLRAEYLFSQQQYSQIHFNYTSGHNAKYLDWRNGYRPKISGNKVNFRKTASADTSYRSFRKYLDSVFMYAGSYSLSKELRSVNVKTMQIGDVFIIGAFPGHAVIVVDMAENPATGEKLFMIAQSYMPAQNIHVLKNPNNSTKSPWYSLNFGTTLKTPEWTFSSTNLKRF